MYFITGVTDISNEIKSNTRCFGYFRELRDAEEAVLNNVFDMWETIYNYIIIEEIEEGIHSISRKVNWYRYNEEKDRFEKINYNDEIFCNYAIG